jgi:hypothetical protein
MLQAIVALSAVLPELLLLTIVLAVMVSAIGLMPTLIISLPIVIIGACVFAIGIGIPRSK